MKKTVMLFHLALILCVSFALPSTSLAWRGKVASVIDGDVIKVRHGKKVEKVKLYGIDAPEMKQNFGRVSKEYVASLIAGRVVDVDSKDIDRHGRTVALVFVNGDCVNELAVKNGYAWVDRQYCSEIFCSRWIDDEEMARYGGIGMWSDPYISVPHWQQQ